MSLFGPSKAEYASALQKIRELEAKLQEVQSLSHPSISSKQRLEDQISLLKQQHSKDLEAIKSLRDELCRLRDSSSLSSEAPSSSPSADSVKISPSEAARISSICKSTLFSSFPIFSDFSVSCEASSGASFSVASERFNSAITERMRLFSPSVSCQIRSGSGETYFVTLESCTCSDFTFRHIPCKHMYRLAIEVGLCGCMDVSPILDELDVINKARTQSAKALYHLRLAQRKMDEASALAKAEFSQMSSLIESQQAELDARLADLESKEAKFNQLVLDNKQSHPALASAIADFYSMYDTSLIANLRSKARPARKASDDVARISAAKRLLISENRELRYQLDFLKVSVPWLEEFISLPIDHADAIAAPSDVSEEYEYLRDWLSPEEYRALPNVEKFQLALDRYQHRQKSNFDAGVEYERYIGYLYEMQGYRVKYCGATLGLNDMGRDLLAEKDGVTHVIQCKRWSQFKSIHENAIFQLLGSVAHLRYENPLHTYIPVFYTTTELSEVARSCAQQLSIELHESCPLPDYPVIKCNISKCGERIYHLPFDLQYDRIMITPESGECYVRTTAEAEALGFRRAFKWHSG